jgi:hypothetical protein
LQCVFRQKWLLKQPAARKNPLLHESAGTVYEALVYQTDGILCQKKPTIAVNRFRYASDEFKRICAETLRGGDGHCVAARKIPVRSEADRAADRA